MAEFNPSSFTETQSAFKTEVDTQSAVIVSFSFNGSPAKIVAKSTTTVVEFRGLSRSAALQMAANANYNFKHMHGVTFTSGLASQFAPDCEGTECKATVRRINEADFFRVIVTHVSTTCVHEPASGWTKS